MVQQCKKKGQNKDTAEGYRTKTEIEETCRMIQNKWYSQVLEDVTNIRKSWRNTGKESWWNEGGDQ